MAEKDSGRDCLAGVEWERQAWQERKVEKDEDYEEKGGDRGLRAGRGDYGFFTHHPGDL